MIKNYLKIAFRNVVRNKSFSLINIGGLAIGIASALLLYIVVSYELSYDKFQPNYNKIYHVVTSDKFSDGVTYNPGVPYPALDALRLDFPEATIGALVANFGSQVTVPSTGNTQPKKFMEETGFFFSEPQFFKVFEYGWLAGNPAVLDEPNNTVLTQKTAEKYFGDWENAMGKFLLLDNKITVKVAGIIKDVPNNTDFPLSIVTSYKTAKNSDGLYFYTDRWNAISSNFQVFMLLPQSSTASAIDKQLISFVEKNYQQRNGVSKRSHFLQPLSELHFDERFPTFGDHIIKKSVLWTLSLIGIFLILMGCINFINLSTAQAVKRSKEIGIRKVLGSFRKNIFFQVISETALLVIASILLSVLLTYLALPFIKKIAFIEGPVQIFTWQLLIIITVVTFLVTILAGIYPAVVLSGFNPVKALKNKINSASAGGISVRRSLVVLQFSISQILIVATIVAITQMSFIRNADLGFNKETVLLLTTNSDSAMQSRQDIFKQKLLQLPGVQSVSFNADAPSSENSWYSNFNFDHKPSSESNQLSIKYTDEDYFKTFGLQFLTGRPFEKSDTLNEVVINEKLAQQLIPGDPEKVIGKQISFSGFDYKTIVGVVKDFKTGSLKEPIKPTVICEGRSNYFVTAVKLKTNNISKTKSAIEKEWNQFYPEYAYMDSFMDENIRDFYRQDDQMETLYKIFAGIAILISCLGLYGLVSYMAVQKTREIGVRKVLGASVKQIVLLFSKEFTILLLVGSFIAVPVSYFITKQWLQNFEYKIKLSPLIFIAAIIISLLVAWIAVGYKSIRAAMAEPIKSLKTE